MMALLILGGITTPASASSHREGPFITKRPANDNTDLYVFRSYETGREDFVTLISNSIPLQYAGGGPNYNPLDENGVYEIQIDNDHDAIEDITFRFDDVKNTLKGLSVTSGTADVNVPLFNIGQIGPGVNDTDNLNVIQTLDFGVVRGESLGTRGKRRGRLASSTTVINDMIKPVDNIGNKSIPDYPTYALNHVQTFTMPGCSAPGADQSKVFVGQRREAFYLNLGEVFDLVNVADPVADNPGDESKELNTFGDFNTITFAVEVPIACLTQGDEPVIAVWARNLVPETVSHLRDSQIPGFDAVGRLLRKLGIRSNEFRRVERQRGNRFVQISRLGMPLVNEVVIGLTAKDSFNASEPQDDAQFAQFVTNPTFAELLEVLFPTVITAPATPRNDLVATFLTGNAGLNQPSVANAAAYEAQRLNTSIDVTPESSQNRLGFAGGDNAGFPNGRRPKDDVVDATLRVTNGLLLTLDPDTAADAPTGTLPLTDGATENSQTLSNNGPLAFLSGFPYLPHPIAGSPSN